MTKLISVGSRATMDVMLGFQHEGSDVIIRGISHPTTDGMVVTEGVPEEQFQKWLEKSADSSLVSGGFIFPLADDFEAKPVAKEFGHEPALERLATDPEQTKLAEQGAPEDVTGTVDGRPAVVALPEKIVTTVVTEPAKPADPPKPPAGTPAKTETKEIEPAKAQDDPKNDQNFKV